MRYKRGDICVCIPNSWPSSQAKSGVVLLTSLRNMNPLFSCELNPLLSPTSCDGTMVRRPEQVSGRALPRMFKSEMRVVLFSTPGIGNRQRNFFLTSLPFVLDKSRHLNTQYIGQAKYHQKLQYYFVPDPVIALNLAASIAPKPQQITGSKAFNLPRDIHHPFHADLPKVHYVQRW